MGITDEREMSKNTIKQTKGVSPCGEDTLLFLSDIVGLRSFNFFDKVFGPLDKGI